MQIRKATLDEMDEIMEIYAYARRFMAQSGNPDQWGATCWPPRTLIEQDIARGKCYVCCDASRLLAVFYYDFGQDIDPCYAEIEQGMWRDDSPYGVVHRIAAAPNAKGAGSHCIRWAFERCGHLRIDTHADNAVMRHVLDKLGFTYCGIIHIVEDDTPRLAYEKSA